MKSGKSMSRDELATAFEGGLFWTRREWAREANRRGWSLRDDLWQDCLLYCWQHFLRFDPELGMPTTWLSVGVRNWAWVRQRDLGRTRLKRRLWASDAVGNEGWRWTEMAVQPPQSGDDAADVKDHLDAVRRVIGETDYDFARWFSGDRPPSKWSRLTPQRWRQKMKAIREKLSEAVEKGMLTP